ncbi:unnamed protein product [Closterium sp. Naga37s-1]|nr:unnamed protein product [Closterium sp. Naga37s-1]
MGDTDGQEGQVERGGLLWQEGEGCACIGLLASPRPSAHSHHHLTPITISLPPPSHSHHRLTPTTVSLPPPSHSHPPLTPTAISLPSPTHSHCHLTLIPHSLPLPSHSHPPPTPTAISLPSPTHSHCHLTPIPHSLPLPSHSHPPLTPTAISLPSPTHSHCHLTPIPHSLPLPSHSHPPPTPTAISLPSPTHSHCHLTPIPHSLPLPSHSHPQLTPTAISLPSPTHSHCHLTPAPTHSYELIRLVREFGGKTELGNAPVDGGARAVTQVPAGTAAAYTRVKEFYLQRGLCNRMALSEELSSLKMKEGEGVAAYWARAEDLRSKYLAAEGKEEVEEWMMRVLKGLPPHFEMLKVVLNNQSPSLTKDQLLTSLRSEEMRIGVAPRSDGVATFGAGTKVGSSGRGNWDKGGKHGGSGSSSDTNSGRWGQGKGKAGVLDFPWGSKGMAPRGLGDGRVVKAVGMGEVPVVGAGVRTPSLGGAVYVLSLIDDFTRRVWSFPLPNKESATVAKVLRQWHKDVELECGRKLKAVRSDRGGEFLGDAVKAWKAEFGIKTQLSVADTPQQNGVVERWHRTMAEGIRTLLVDSGLPARLWGEALMWVMWVKNRATHSALPASITPMEAWSGQKPHVGMARIWGCMGSVMLHGHEKGGKLDARAVMCVCVGVDMESKGWRMLDPSLMRIRIARDVDFLENVMWKDWDKAKGFGELLQDAAAISQLLPLPLWPPSATADDVEMPPSSRPPAPLSVSVQQQPTPLQQLSGPSVIQRRSATQATSSSSSSGQRSVPLSTGAPPSPATTSPPPVTGLQVLGIQSGTGGEEVGGDAGVVEGMLCLAKEVEGVALAGVSTGDVPRTLAEALRGPEGPAWKAGAEKEVNAMRTMGSCVAPTRIHMRALH